MRTLDQTAGQAAAAAQADAHAAQLQQQIQAATEKAVQEALKGGRISNDTKEQLRDQIRTAIEASREAVQGIPQPPAPPGGFTFTTGGGNVPWDSGALSQIEDISAILGVTLVCCVVGFPLARAIARWIDRRGAKSPAPAPELMNRLSAIEQAVESVAVEVERISEGQRFTTRVLSERSHEGAPDFVPARDPVPAGIPANARRS